MSCNLMTFKYPKAAKDHVCDVCGCTIPRGSVHHYQTAIADGSYGSWRVHSDCAEMHWHHNEGRGWDDQTDDYTGYPEYHGLFPHAINRVLLRNELAEIAWRARQAA